MLRLNCSGSGGPVRPGVTGERAEMHSEAAGYRR